MNSYFSPQKNFLYFVGLLPKEIRCGITTRYFDCCNYYHTDKAPQEQNIKKLASVFGAKKVIAPLPEQGTNIIVADPLEKKWLQQKNGDAIILNTDDWKNQKPMLIFPTGDCPIIILYDDHSWTLIHCGWRGIRGGIIAKTIEELRLFRLKKKEAKVII